MPADEVTHGTSVGESRARSGPRHAAPRKPLLTRLNMPAGKAIALAAMPTAVLMGMGFTPTLALAEDPASKSLTADEYKDCVTALEAAEDGKDTSASPTPTPSASATESADSSDDEAKDEDKPAGDDAADDSASDDTPSDDSSSPDSGSDDKETGDDSAPTDTSDKPASDDAASDKAAADTASDSASESGSGGNVLEDIGSALEDLFTPDDKESGSDTPSPSTSPSPSPSAADSGSGEDTDDDKDSGKDGKGSVDVTDKVEDSAKDVTGTADDETDEKTDDKADDAEDTAKDTAADATATPSPSPSESTDLDDCFVATDDESGVEKGIPALPSDPWYLNASSLLLKGADYKGVVKVRTADGKVKEVLKYVISDGTDIGDLHQTVDDKQAGVTYHVQAGKGTTSTIRDGQTVMYTESISGNLLGLIPVTFDPKHPPPLNIPLIYFTKVKVVQAGQFGGTLTVPGLHQFTTK
ncbi:hypothetical protein [Streptomyces bottropensis]|uniref:hypothetical protein n=1 Tax=Streptomyces bottropensis TaxID=42235 RepID=UPI0036C12D36